MYNLRSTTRDHDWLLYKEELNEPGLTLVIIRERTPLAEIEDIEITNEEKTFKEEECSICLNNKPNVLFCNCGHVCICNQCLSSIQKKKCPICKMLSNIIRIV